MWNIKWFLKGFFQVRFNGSMNFSIYLIIPYKSSVYIKRYTIVYRYIVLAISWYCLSKFYSVLTRYLEKFIPVSSTVPVCCIAIERKVTFLTVEHKKERIRHNLLCVKTYTALLPSRFPNTSASMCTYRDSLLI